MLGAAVRIATTLLVIVASATACGTKSAGTKYISERYGYEIVLRGEYGEMRQASGQWDGSFPFGASGQVDLIVDQTQDSKFAVAAKPVPPGMPLSRWEAFVVRLQRQVCHRLRNFRASSLGGEPAREFVNSCPEYHVITLAALHNGRGYLLNYLSHPSYSAASDRRIYEAGRRAFQFTQK